MWIYVCLHIIIDLQTYSQYILTKSSDDRNIIRYCFLLNVIDVLQEEKHNNIHAGKTYNLVPISKKTTCLTNY